jgi:nucleotide-binding universal stress UspA family protein
MRAPEPGAEIDGFRLGDRLHTGTMAWIYRLLGPEGPLPLVMKIPRLGPGEPAINVISFEQCRMVLGALAQGPHYPTLVAYGDVETTPYLVMEYVEGRPLSEWMREAPRAAEEVAALGAKLALALHEIHRQDVIHLDLKSANVLYRHGGDATVVDFGLAHHGHFPDLLAEEVRTPVGNWEYMSPEQILGIRCDPRSDIFALGALLYELATGQLPFGRPRTLVQLRRRLYLEPAPPRAVRAVVPDWLQEVILHCLEVDNRKRYASAAEVAFDLANPPQVPRTERASRSARAGWLQTFGRRMSTGSFEPAPCPPLTSQAALAPIVLVALAFGQGDEALYEALRGAVRRLCGADGRCRIACATVVPPAAALTGEGEAATATGRHIRHLVELRRWARPLELAEERLTYHVLESEKPAAALIDYASVNEVDQILVGAPGEGRGPPGSGRGHWPVDLAAQVASGAPCSVTIVRARPHG